MKITILASVLLLTSAPAAAQGDKKTRAEQIDELCKDKSGQAALAVGQINNPGATQSAINVKKAKKKKIDYGISISQDDKTKTYTVTAEFSLENKWCQIERVQLTSVPQ